MGREGREGGGREGGRESERESSKSNSTSCKILVAKCLSSLDNITVTIYSSPELSVIDFAIFIACLSGGRREIKRDREEGGEGGGE